MPLSRPACPICACDARMPDAKATRLLALGPPFAVVRCTGCGLRRLEPMPTDDEYGLLYETSYFGGHRDAPVPSWIKEYASITYEEALTEARLEAYRARLRRLAAAFPHRGTLLDVGMATGEFAAMARADGWNVTGLEVSEEACKAARERGIEAHCTSLHECRLDRRFDVVHLHHVFEHFTDPRAALDRLKSLMSPNALLILEVPNQFESWTRRLVNAIRWITGSEVQRSVLSIHHPVFYSQASIANLLTGTGFEMAWRRTYFPERWTGPVYRQVLRAIDYVADRLGGKGENIEIAAKLSPSRSTEVAP